MTTTGAQDQAANDSGSRQGSAEARGGLRGMVDRPPLGLGKHTFMTLVGLTVTALGIVGLDLAGGLPWSDRLDQPLGAAAATSESEVPPAAEPGPFDAAALRRAVGPATKDGVFRGTKYAVTYRGEQIVGDGVDTPVIPASTLKLLTCATALAELGPDHRFTTMVRLQQTSGTPTLVLVGGGDPFLTARGADEAGQETPLADLVVSVAAALSSQRIDAVRVAVDDRLFGGVSVPASWPGNFVPEGIAGRVSALSLDAGRVAPTAAARVADPALTAGRVFADGLEEAGITVEGEVARHAAPAEAPVIGALRSAPLSIIVGHTLRESDNDAAEVLLRQVAVARNAPATAAKAPAAQQQALADLGLPMDGVRIADGSGLSGSNRVTVAALTWLLRAAMGEPDTVDADVTARLSYLLDGMPRGRWDGTLVSRFAADEVNDVRAKTGTLRTVTGLAGVTVDESGHDVVVVAVRNNPSVGVAAARSAIDRFVTAVATCDCGPRGSASASASSTAAGD